MNAWLRLLLEEVERRRRELEDTDHSRDPGEATRKEPDPVRPEEKPAR